MTFHTVTYCKKANTKHYYLPAQWDVTRGIAAKLQIEGYVIKNYLYLINVEVSRSINFNVNQQSTDKLPTDYQQSADMLPTVGRQIAKTMEKTVSQLSADSRPTVGRQ